jgi:CheY-like chemotaxis protein
VAQLSPPPCVLVVADRERVGELVAALSELSDAEVLVSSGGDDAIELFETRRPAVVVVTAALELGDTRSLIVALRAVVPRGHVAVVIVGDDAGPIRTALDALELSPDRFVTRPLSAKALRFAVTGGIDAVRAIREATPASPLPPIGMATMPGPGLETPSPALSSGRLSSASASVTASSPGPSRATLRARWEALADSLHSAGDDEPGAAPAPVVIQPRRRQLEGAREESSAQGTIDDAAAPVWHPGTTSELAPAREPTLILREPMLAGDVVVAARTSSEELWSDPVALAEVADREPRGDDDAASATDDDRLDRCDDGAQANAADRASRAAGGGPAAPAASPAPRDFARELRAKMSMMAQRLFHGAETPPPSDHAPRHDHHTEIDLASLGDERSLVDGGGDLEPASAARDEARGSASSPGSWDAQVRDRGLPDRGAIMRGVSDAAMLLARMVALGATGQIRFRRDDVETVVHCDRGRPVFAASNEPRDRMGELLLREGKITAAQYARCQAVVAESGRRMGEILVDFGYLKRRELLPAVRRHVEDLLYSLFGWDRGSYAITIEREPCAERIRLSRHPAALILEGIRRKFDRGSLEKLVGPASTVIEVRDRERLGGIVQLGDLTAEERAALGAFDGQVDLAQVARVAGVGCGEILPLAWGLCVLGLASARRIEAEVPDDAAALVGETDLAIDRERVRARWQLVTDADYFALLGVRRDATGFEIRRAYQSARRDFAADCFPGDLRRELARELDDIAQVLEEAFRVLRDDRLRQTYLANLVDR